MKKIFISLIFFIFCGIFMQTLADENSQKSILPSEVGKIESIENFSEEAFLPFSELNQIKQSVEVKILTGSHKGEKVLIENVLMGNPMYDIKLKKGDKVILHAEQADGGINFFIADKQRVNVLYFLSILFFILLLVVGKKKGFFSLISILTTLGLIFWVLTPLILNGINTILATIVICIISATLTMYLVGGFNAKSTSAILGTVLSLILAGMLSILSIKFAYLTGFSSEESSFLFSAHPQLNFVGLLASAMIIGALGAVMDIGMSIASTINEVFRSNPKLNVKMLFDSGMNVGRDIIGTMANTLILAYLGGAFFLVLLSNNIDLQKFFNLNQVATEISSALIGSIAVVACVPISAIISAYLIRRGRK
jgi:uncharacterized membrane protein